MEMLHDLSYMSLVYLSVPDIRKIKYPPCYSIPHGNYRAEITVVWILRNVIF